MATASSRRGGTSTPRERGARGNKRGKEAQKRRHDLHLATPRVAVALADARTERQRLEAILAAQARTETEGSRKAAIRRVWVKDGAEVTDLDRPRVHETRLVLNPDSRALGEKGWTLGQARVLVTDGYPLEAVVRRTGYGAWWFRDLVGNDGYRRAVAA